MKNTLVFGVILLFLGSMLLNGCGKTASALGQQTTNANQVEVQSGFTIKKSENAADITLTFTAASKGVAGDGFYIQCNSKDYFLSGEAGVISIPRVQHRVTLVAYRAFSTNRNGYILGAAQVIDLFSDKPLNTDFNLQLPAPEKGINSWIFAPSIIVNFRNMNLQVSQNIYQGPPQHADDIEMQFSSFVRISSEYPKYSVFAAPSTETGKASFGLPSEPQYAYAAARTRFFDTVHNRIIVSELSNVLEFEQ